MKTQTWLSIGLFGLAVTTGLAGAWAQGGPGGGPPPGMRPSMADMDANQDGKVTQDEFTAASEKRDKGHFAHMDADSNGVLSKEEMAKGPGRGHGPGQGRGPEGDTQRQPPPPPPDGAQAGGPPPGPPRLEDMDADKDGQVTQAEFNTAFTKRHQEMFKRLDANSDGSLSKEELEKAPGPGRRGPGGDRPDGPPPAR